MRLSWRSGGGPASCSPWEAAAGCSEAAGGCPGACAKLVSHCPLACWPELRPATTCQAGRQTARSVHAVHSARWQCAQPAGRRHAGRMQPGTDWWLCTACSAAASWQDACSRRLPGEAVRPALLAVHHQAWLQTCSQPPPAAGDGPARHWPSLPRCCAPQRHWRAALPETACHVDPPDPCITQAI